MKRTDIAYVAGIVDGEGSIGIYRRNGRSDVLPRVSVAVNNTNEWICQWLHLSFGGGLYQDRRHEDMNHKPAWRWVVQGTLALSFLETIFPYLRLKRPQAELAIAYLKKRKGMGRYATEGEKAIVEAQKILMHKMNQTGVHPREIRAS